MRPAVKIDVRIRALTDTDYPRGLGELSRPPPAIYLAGQIAPGPRVAIVGTRRADVDALGFAERLAAELGRRGASIVSGGAIGIDRAAHAGALAVHANTIAVHGTPLDRLYPRANIALFRRILAEGGGWLSELAPGESVTAARFIARNRLIAALADAVVIVQAPERSGALATAEFAQVLGRPLFAVPAAPWDRRSSGSLELLARGAELCLSATDVARKLGLAEPELAHEGEIDPEKRAVLEAIEERALHLDEIVRATKLSAQVAQRVLIELEIEKRTRNEGGRWRAAIAQGGAPASGRRSRK
jgi:DNA processing protein